MSSSFVHYLVPAVLFLHGVGHWMGVLTAVGLFETGTWHSRSWLLTGVIGEPASRVLALVLWTVCSLGFILAAVGALGWPITIRQWRTIAAGSAVLSFLTLFLFWNGFATLFPNKTGAVVVNVAILYLFFMANWNLGSTAT